MGSPKKSRKKYKKPLVIWDEALIKEQKIILRNYGLKNKREIWKSEGLVKRCRSQAKKLIASKTEQSKKEKEQLINKLVKLGMIKPGSQLNEILSITLKDVLERRLQTIIFKKGLTKTISQARQFIVHGHVSINEEKINAPSFLVPLDLENKISFNPVSKLSNDQHPERIKERSRKGKKKIEEKVDEIDIFKDTEEIIENIEIEKTEEENLEKTKKETPKKIKEKVENKIPEEAKTRKNKDKPSGKAK